MGRQAEPSASCPSTPTMYFYLSTSPETSYTRILPSINTNTSSQSSVVCPHDNLGAAHLSINVTLQAQGYTGRFAILISAVVQCHEQQGQVQKAGGPMDGCQHLRNLFNYLLQTNSIASCVVSLNWSFRRYCTFVEMRRDTQARLHSSVGSCSTAGRAWGRIDDEQMQKG